MTFTIKKKLGVLIGVLLALFLALGVVVYRNLQTIGFELHAIVTIHQPISTTAYEMDVQLLRFAYRVMGYLQNRDQGNIDRLEDAEANFERLLNEYSRLAETKFEQELSRTIKAKFADMQALGKSLMAREDEQHQIFETLADRFVRWDAFIESTMKPTILPATDQQASWKLEKIAELNAAFNAANRLTNELFMLHTDDKETRIASAWKECDTIIDQYMSAALSQQEQGAMARLRELFQEIRQYSDQAVALERQNQAELEKFILFRREFGMNILYEQAIKGTAEKDLLRAGELMLQSVDASRRWLFIFLGASAVIALILGLSLAYNITSRLNRVVNAAAMLSQGDLSVELRNTSNDEIGVLVVAFQQMIAYIRAVAHVAETIAEGNLQVQVTPQSERDVLNTSFQRMVTYLQGVAAVTEQVSDKELHVQVTPKSEHDLLNQSLQKMVANLRGMMMEIERQSWLKDGVSQLSLALSGDLSLKEVCQNAISFVCRYVNAGSGTLYSFDAKTDTLKLLGAFAFTERSKLSNAYQLGEGVVGQVALERAPILLKHPTRQDGLIVTGTVSHAPAQTYTFPLLYESTLYGVIELAAMQPLDEHAQNFLSEANRVIATVLFSTLQREKVQELLLESQKAQEIAETAAQEAEVAKYEAQEKAQEVQEANQQLEEQQQKLQQQSEELQQVNAHLEEQQQQLHQQSEELRQQNETLNTAKLQLDKRAADLEMASKYKSEFLANMSHELRTPLNSIILLSKMLSKNERQNLDDKEVKQVSVINQAGEELLRLINDILDLSKIESGKVTMNITEFSIAELFQTFKDLFRSIAEEKGLEFIIHEEFNAVLKTDRDKLSQILRNLLANAFKFTKQGSVALRAVQMPGKADTVLISVEDTGVGIPKDKQQIVFEAFQQADGSISREFGGTGLGLSIAREYAKLLQGAISLESEVGKGTTFTLTLPAMLKQILDLTPSSAPQSGTKPIAPLKKPQVFSVATEVEDDRALIVPGEKVILIIEDNADLAQSTMDVTRGMGFKALVALTGHDGLELAAKFIPTGILLDLVLPDMNGMELLRELKSTRELRHIPVHIFSSKERDNSYRAVGAIGYFQKPVNEIDIQNAVDNLMAVSEKYPKRLLIVEDDETQREAIRDLLDSGDDVQITGVSSQDQAIAEIETGEYDAAIIDLGLKGGSGYDICRFIKEQHVKLPVIIYTGRELTEEEERELRKYTDSIIIKTAKSYERLTDETSLFLHQMYHGETEQKPRSAPPKPLQADGNLSGKKILIVDDDVKNVFVLASALENHGATVVDAKNGQVAIEVLNQEPDFDLVLMDVMMPVMDGYTAIRQIRKDKRFERLPIIAITAKALKEDRQKCIQAGADDYLSKPVDYDGLIRLVKAWIEKE